MDRLLWRREDASRDGTVGRRAEYVVIGGGTFPKAGSTDPRSRPHFGTPGRLGSGGEIVASVHLHRSHDVVGAYEPGERLARARARGRSGAGAAEYSGDHSRRGRPGSRVE